jgi:CRP-like cAMP-binding protein
MKTNFLFQHLNAVQRQAVVNVMKPVNVKKGEWIIKQGDAGDKFYIVDNGRYEVRVKGGGVVTGNTPNRFTISEEEMDRLAGSVVHVYESGVDQHPGFGELSLM